MVIPCIVRRRFFDYDRLYSVTVRAIPLQVIFLISLLASNAASGKFVIKPTSIKIAGQLVCVVIVWFAVLIGVDRGSIYPFNASVICSRAIRANFFEFFDARLESQTTRPRAELQPEPPAALQCTEIRIDGSRFAIWLTNDTRDFNGILIGPGAMFRKLEVLRRSTLLHTIRLNSPS